MVTVRFLLDKTNSFRYGTVKTVISFQGFEMPCLLDTGADISVWTSNEEDLLAYFPEAVRENCVAVTRGFGKGYEIASIYRIPDLHIADEFGNEILFKQFICAVIPKEFAHQFVLSYSLFEKSNIHICSFDGNEIFDVNTLEINFKNQENATAIKYKDISIEARRKYGLADDIKVVDCVYVFTEENI